MFIWQSILIIMINVMFFPLEIAYSFKIIVNLYSLPFTNILLLPKNLYELQCQSNRYPKVLCKSTLEGWTYRSVSRLTFQIFLVIFFLVPNYLFPEFWDLCNLHKSKKKFKYRDLEIQTWFRNCVMNIKCLSFLNRYFI